MKIKIVIAAAAIVLVLAQQYTLSKYRKENKILTNNQETLLQSSNKYKVNDSLNAIKINELTLSVSEYYKHREQDAKLIKDLKISKSELQSTIKLNTETIYKLKIALKDSTVRDTVTNQIDTLKCFSQKTKWYNISGRIAKDTIDIAVHNIESLIVVERLQKKKFWFMKLPIPIFGYKNRQINIISKNPNTYIENVEYIRVK